MKKILMFMFLCVMMIVSWSEAQALSWFTRCEGTCNRQEKVCRDGKTQEWCKKYCAKKIDRQTQTYMDGTCLCHSHCTQQRVCGNPKIQEWCKKECGKFVDVNGKSYGTLYNCHSISNNRPPSLSVRDLDREIEQCSKQINIIQVHAPIALAASNSKRNSDEFAERKKAFITTANQLAAMMNSQAEKLKQEKNEKTLLTDLTTYKVTCKNMADKLIDFAYWIQGLQPPGGFVSFKSGTSLKEIDTEFNRLVNDHKPKQ